MSQIIQIKRGLESARTGVTPAVGEFIWTTDAQELWIGDNSTAGGVKVTGNVEGDYIPTTQKAAINGVATLGADAKIPSDQLPALAITSTFVAADEAAQLALAGVEEGDVVVRTDENKSYIHNGGVADTMADFQELLTPTDAVLSVNGATGAVTLTSTDITEGTNLYYTDTRADARIAAFNASATTDALTEGTTNLYYTDARADAQIAAASIDDLSDVDTTTAAPSVDDFIKWDGTNWIPGTPQTIAMDDLSDVDTTTTAPTNGQVLSWNGGGWVPTDDVDTTVATLNDVGNVNITGITDGQIISWDNGASEWVNSALPTGVDGTFAGLTDTPANYTGAGGYVLKVNAGATAVEFVDQTTDLVTEGSVNLYWTQARFNTAFAANDTDDLTEGASNLYFTTARADAQIAAADIEDLNNVDSAAATDGQVMAWNNTNSNWEPANVDGGTF